MLIRDLLDYFFAELFKTHFAKSYLTFSKCASPISVAKRTTSCFAMPSFSAAVFRRVAISSVSLTVWLYESFCNCGLLGISQALKINVFTQNKKRSKIYCIFGLTH